MNQQKINTLNKRELTGRSNFRPRSVGASGMTIGLNTELSNRFRDGLRFESGR